MIIPMKDYHTILFPYAYNILGSSDDAKDAVQDVLSKFITTSHEGIENEKGYLIKSVINQSINIRNRRKKLLHGDVWLPEPVATEEADTAINLKDIVSYSLLVLLEQLNPKERAVFILKEAFGYSHEEIADVLSSTVENSRKLLSRAKSKLEGSRQPLKVLSDSPYNAILEDFVNAIRGRDTKTLENLLSQDITFHADGGDKLKVIKKICTGMQEVIELLFLIDQRFNSKMTVIQATINHQPALLYYRDSKLVVCQVLSVSDNKIFQIDNVVDPEKLKGIEGLRR